MVIFYVTLYRREGTPQVVIKWADFCSQKARTFVQHQTETRFFSWTSDFKYNKNKFQFSDLNIFRNTWKNTYFDKFTS